MFGFVIILIVIAAVLLVLVVLAQNSKGGGLASNFSGSASQMMGVKKTGDILEKLTWGFAIAIMVLSLSSNLFINKEIGAQKTEDIMDSNIKKAKEKVIVSPSGSDMFNDTTSSELPSDSE